VIYFSRVYDFLAQGQWYRKVSAVGPSLLVVTFITWAMTGVRMVILNLSSTLRPVSLFAESRLAERSACPQLVDQTRADGWAFPVSAPPFSICSTFSTKAWRALHYEQLPAKGDVTYEIRGFYNFITLLNSSDSEA
jgi:hypothetical protein